MLVAVTKSKAKSLYYLGYEVYAFIAGQKADVSQVRKLYLNRKQEAAEFDGKLERWSETQLLANEKLNWFVKERSVRVKYSGRGYNIYDAQSGDFINRVAGDARLARYLVQSFLVLQYLGSVNGEIQAAYKLNYKSLTGRLYG